MIEWIHIQKISLMNSKMIFKTELVVLEMDQLEMTLLMNFLRLIVNLSRLRKMYATKTTPLGVMILKQDSKILERNMKQLGKKLQEKHWAVQSRLLWLSLLSYVSALQVASNATRVKRIILLLVLKKIHEMKKEREPDAETMAVYEKLVTRSLFGNINASRNSA